MNLVIDIGNSRVKVAVLEHGEIRERWSYPGLTAGDARAILARYPSISRAILSSTRGEPEPAEELIRETVPFFLRMGAGVAVPVANLYRTPETLGADRLAAAVGATTLFPGENLMIADLGSAITVDFVSAAGEFLGGSISPGARMRFRALHEYTGRLPMGSFGELPQGIARTTAEAVAAGVAEGIRHEIEGYFTEYAAKMAELKLILTGGDADFFAERFKNTIFANYDLVTIGLNRILDYNAPEQDTP